MSEVHLDDGASLAQAFIAKARAQLIDMSRRNPMLNSKLRSRSAVVLQCESREETLANLLRGTTISVLPVREEITPESEGLEVPETVEQLLQEIDSSLEDASKRPWRRVAHIDPHAFYVDALGKDLGPRVKTIAQRANEEFLDRGIWTMYLALGSLTWIDVDESSYAAPLLMIPVELSESRREFHLRRSDGDVVLNPAMQLKCAEFATTIPEPDAEAPDFSMESWLAEVATAVARLSGWKVEDAITLARYSFAKESMYRDLLENEALLLAHPLVQAIVDPRNADISDVTLVEPDEVDEVAPPEKVPLVLDADASQRAAIATAAAGASLVIDGPPGTGKSQTIANLIGNYLAQQKTVLFVSEKAAALEVVQNRLTAAGLGGYILEMHSHKATRKEVIADLGEALRDKHVAPRGMAEADIQRLRKLREALSAASAAANEIRPGLLKSFNEVSGMIANLRDVPDAPHAEIEYSKIDQDLIIELREAARKAQNAYRAGAARTEFPWLGTTLTRHPSEDLRYLLKLIEESLRCGAALQPALDALAWTSDEIPQLIAALQYWREEPGKIEIDWLLDEQRRDRIQALKTLRDLRAKRDHARGIIEGSLRDVDCVEALTELPSQPPHLRGGGWKKLHAIDIRVLLESLRQRLELAQLCEQVVAQVDEGVGWNLPSNPDGIKRRLQLLKALNNPAFLSLPRIDTAELKSTQASLRALKACWEAESGAAAAAQGIWNPGILDLDLENLQAKFSHIYKGLRKLSGEYRRERRLLLTNGAPLLDRKNLVGALEIALRWQRTVRTREQVELEHSARLGELYGGHSTRWEQLSEMVDEGLELCETLERPVDDGLRNSLLTHAAFTRTSRERGIAAFTEWSEDQEASLSKAAGCLVPQETLSSAAKALEELVNWLSQLQLQLEETDRMAAEGVAFNAELIATMLNLKEQWSSTSQGLNSKWRELHMLLDSRLSDPEGDFEATQLVLERTIELQRLLHGAVSQGAIMALQAIAPSDVLASATAQQQWDVAKAQILNWFESRVQSEIRVTLDRPAAAASYLRELQADAAGPDLAYEFAQAAERIAGAGLAKALVWQREMHGDPTALELVLVKSLLSTWADELLRQDNRLSAVRAHERNALVSEFQELDKKILSAAIATVVARAEGMRPKTAVGAAATIRREAQKKSRHMAIRQLLAETHSVATAIKPVFMMSPLTVSQFLPPQISFDVVIFDEASQVKPEDALNSIYRGRSLVIAGDAKQLPPTNYWDRDSSATESEEDDSDVADFESILDIAKTAFPSRTLKWHYRSRHEDLIAFSNHNFYGGELFTYPSAQHESDDLGVAFIKHSGLYARGKSKAINVDEAKLVADRVRHHYDSRVGKSLGVVTFSAAQKEAVERAVELMLEQRPDLRTRMTGDRLSGFFVKNLESVQGDERDVIIFSVGYGRDAHGVVSRNFGPLSKVKSPGWRRLNVAITRALYRIEVVSSMTASDIAPSENPSIEHFKKYLAFAEQGPRVLQLDLGDAGAQPESPFEESVLGAIRRLGYVAQPQVGTAGYRIDLGVKHPTKEGVFVLGVECDGYQYHSSAVARDRDRLRQSVLEGLGWRLHRIWGTSWYRNLGDEESRLKQAIEAAIADEDAWIGLGVSQPESLPAQPVIVQRVTDSIANEAPLWVQQYALAPRLPRLPRSIQPGEGSAVHHMIGFVERMVATEGPVHISLVEERLREHWEIGRLGSNIRANLERATRLASVNMDPDGFLNTDAATLQVRPAGLERRVGQVAIEELALAMSHLVADALSITDEALFTAVARLYGWQRSGTEIQKRLEAALQMVLQDRRVVRGELGLQPGQSR